MADTQDMNWKEIALNRVDESLQFFGNKGKLTREKWIVKRLLDAFKINYKNKCLIEGDEPYDVCIDGANFQTKEILDEGRKRGKELKERRDKIDQANDRSVLLSPYTPIEITFSEIINICHAYALKLCNKNKYGSRECEKIDLLIYFNFKDHLIIPPLKNECAHLNFRSLSIVSNQYCTVVYATNDAPEFIKNNVGKVVDFFEL